MLINKMPFWNTFICDLKDPPPAPTLAAKRVVVCSMSANLAGCQFSAVDFVCVRPGLVETTATASGNPRSVALATAQSPRGATRHQLHANGSVGVSCSHQRPPQGENDWAYRCIFSVSSATNSFP